MKIEVIFDKPTNGYWDGGQKFGGTFEVEPFPLTGMTKFGCWELNLYFSVKTGKTNKITQSRAEQWLLKHCGVPCTINGRHN